MEDWEDEPILPPLKKEQLKNRWDDEDVDENDVKDSWEDEEETALAAKTTAKSIVDMQNVVEEDSEFSEEDDMEGSAVQGESEDENDKRCKAALDKLEKASEDTILGQGLKGIAGIRKCVKRGSDFVQKLENSAVNIAESIQQGGIPSSGSIAPSLIESGKAFTAKGMQVLELVGKETMDLLITKTGIEVDKKGAQAQDDEDQLFEEVTFDRCFYIY
ncbi:hypothetical protein ACSBR1_034091 [Camellia fascicularis]